MVSGRKNRHWWWGVAVVIVLIATFFRFFQLGTHPLGIFFDPAINGLDAVRLIQRGGYVLFFPTNGGRESLFIYLLIPYITAFGTTPFAVRALTATLSLLNVVVMYAFLRDLGSLHLSVTPGLWYTKWIEQRTQPFLAALGALIMATMYWHISVTRLGQRPILVPLLAVIIYWFFLRGWVYNRRSWFIASGVALGLAGYTYGAARLLPVILIVAIIPEFLIGGRNSPKRRQVPSLANLAAFLVAAAIVYAPMAWYLLNHPVQFAARAGSVMVWNFLDTPAAIAAELGRNVVRVLGFFCCTGSPNPIFGEPGFPGLSPLVGVFLLIGIIITGFNWRNLFYRLALLWWGIGIMPSVVAIEAPHPLRMIVSIPPTAILVAVGLMFASSWLVSRPIFNKPGVRSSTLATIRNILYYGFPVAIILLPLPALHRAFFVQWTEHQETRGVYDYGAIAIRDAVLANTSDSIPIYLPLSRYNDSTLLYYLSDSFEREATLNAAPGSTAIVISPDRNADDEAWVRLLGGTAQIIPPLNKVAQQIIHTALVEESATQIRTADGETVARLASLESDPVTSVQSVTELVDVSFGPMRLVGVNYDPTIGFESGSNPSIPVTLFWEANSSMQNEYEVLIRLETDNRQAVGNGDGRPTDWVYPTSFWRPDQDQVAAQHVVTSEPDLPPGRYWLAVSVLEPATGQRLPLSSGTSDSPNTFYIGPLKKPLPPPHPLPALTSVSVAFNNIAHLTGYDTEPELATGGDHLEIKLLWEAETLPEVDYTVFIHLLDSAGQLVANADSPPLSGQYPTTIWTPGEQILDRHVLPLPDNLAPGEYRLAIGLYYQPTGERVPVVTAGSGETADDRFVIPQPVIIQER